MLFSGLFLVCYGVGVVLTLNLLPVQDADTLTESELLALQKEFSLNYNAGMWLQKMSLWVLIPLAIRLIFMVRKGTKKETTK